MRKISEKMRVKVRPLKQLFESLRKLGIVKFKMTKNGHLPIIRKSGNRPIKEKRKYDKI